MKVWYVNFDDTDFAYVVAANRDDAIKTALDAWGDQLGFSPGDPEYVEHWTNGPMEVREEPRIESSAFGPGALVSLGLAVWFCDICDAQLGADKAGWTFEGMHAFCSECQTSERRPLALEHPRPVGNAIVLSTEF